MARRIGNELFKRGVRFREIRESLLGLSFQLVIGLSSQRRQHGNGKRQCQVAEFILHTLSLESFCCFLFESAPFWGHTANGLRGSPCTRLTSLGLRVLSKKDWQWLFWSSAARQLLLGFWN